MRAFLLSLAVFVGLGSLTPALASAPVAHPQRATFGAGPANAKAIDGRPYFTYQSSPGGRITDHLGIVNLAHRPQVVQVYTVDASSTAAGGFVYASRSAPRKDAGGWVAVGSLRASSSVRLPPRSSTVLPLHVRIPRNATPGDHAAGVVVSLTSTGVNSKGERVSLQQRVATRMLFRISGALRPQLSVESLHVTYRSATNPFGTGRAVVTYQIHNTGNVILGGHQQLSVHGLFGSTGHAPALPMIPAILPGGVVPMRATVTGIRPELRMSATVRVTPLAVTGDVDPGLHPTSSTVHFWAPPWGFLVIVLLIALGLYLFRRYRGGRPRPGAHRRNTPATTPENEVVH